MRSPLANAAFASLLCMLLVLSPIDAIALEATRETAAAEDDEQAMAEEDVDDEGGMAPQEGQDLAPAGDAPMEVIEEEPRADGEAEGAEAPDQGGEAAEGEMGVVEDDDPQAGQDAQGRPADDANADAEEDAEQAVALQDGQEQPDSADAELATQAGTAPAAASVPNATRTSTQTTAAQQPSLQAEASTKTAASVVVKAYVQGSGWRTGKKAPNGEITLGSSSSGMRLEALQLSLGGTQGGIQYRAHVQRIGWQAWKTDGKTAGSANSGRRMEALRINLTGAAKDNYDIYYRVYSQDRGWMGWAKNGALSGTTSYGKRIEALQVKLVAKGGEAPTGGRRKAYEDRGFAVQGHQQHTGWMAPSTGYRFTVGKPGSKLRLEALAIDRPTSDVSGSVVYSAHVQNIGWQTRRTNGGVAGSVGDGLRVEGIRIRLTGTLQKRYDAWYRVYVRGIGWMNWTKNGKSAGTEGFLLPVDAMQVSFLAKGSSAPSSKGRAVSTAYATNSSIALWYRANVEGAWQGHVTDGATAGTTGASKAIKAMSAQVNGIGGTVSYKLHLSKKGWIPSQSNGARAGDGANTVQAFRVSLKGDVRKFYDVWYRAYVQKGGWLDWTKNGKTAGSMGLGLRMEAMQIQLVPRGGAAPGPTTHPTYNYVVKNGKAGWQNPPKYPQVSSRTVQLPSYCTGYHTYVTPSRISLWASREECVEAFIGRAYEYLGTTYREPWSQAPGIGVDCSGLVLQCLYATGMDLEHAAGTSKVGGYNPYNHFHVPAQTYNSMRWLENNTFMPVSLSNIRRGDLIFYTGHVAIYLGGGQIIHSTSAFGGSVMVSSLYVWSPIAAQRPFV